MIENEDSVISVFNDEIKQKIDILIKGFNEIGINLDNEISEEEINQFLNSRTLNNKEFNPIIKKKLLEQLNINNENPNITTEKFIKGYIQFESDINDQIENFRKKYKKSKLNYENFQNECRKYQNEKINEEGFCDNAKITLTIENINLENKIEGIKSIIVKLLYNNEEKEIEFIPGEKNEINKIFEL